MTGETERIIGKVELTQRVLYSFAQIDRMEKRGEFPKRIQLGPNRVGWLLSEILAWIDDKADGRW